MSWYRWLSCAVLLGVVDAAWLYLLLGLLGFVSGIGHAPLSWLVVTVVLVLGVVARATHDLIPANWRLRAVLLPILALLVGWLAVGSARALHADTLGLAWPVELVQGQFKPATLMTLLLTLCIVVGLWQQGVRRGGAVAGTMVVARSFRAGLVVFTMLLALESAGDLDLGTRTAMGPFFVASLLGMALARAPAHGVTLYAWLVSVIAAIVAMIVSGLVLALFAVALVRGGFSALHDAWLDFAHAVSRSVSSTLSELLGTHDPGTLDLQSAAAEPSQALMLLVSLLAAVVFAPLLYRSLNAPPAPELPHIAFDLGSAECESIAEADTHAIGQLVESLLPVWPWRRRFGLNGHALPAHPQLARAYVLYHHLLAHARAGGVAINPAHTPRERVASLRTAFPELPVERLTAVFEAACYGRQVTPECELKQLSDQCGFV